MMGYESENMLMDALELWERRVALAVRHIAGALPTAKVWICGNVENRLRLMNWKVWSLRHHVSVEFILATLYKVWRCSPKFCPDGSVSLGLSASAATGKRAREIIQDEVLRTYPAKENELLAKEEIRSRWLDLKPVKGNNYVKAILKKRAKANTTPRNHRTWRGNPWN